MTRINKIFITDLLATSHRLSDRRSMHIYDYIIIGSGLTGLTIAQKISQETDNILLLEAQEITGGTNRPVTLGQHVLNNGLRYMPASDASEKALNFLQELIEKPIIHTSVENLVETYEASGFKRFIGFGDKSPEFYDQLSYYLGQNEFVLSSQPYEWVTELAQKLESKILKKSIVTRFGFEGLDSDKPKLTHIVVNGSKQLHAQNFIFAGPVKELCLLVPDDVLSLRNKAKLKKSLAWQSIGLDLVHETAIEKTNLFLLNGTTDDDIGPCIGRFTGQVSQWTSFIDSEEAEDTENIGFVLKKMKRQIKRAFPELSDSIKKERISISPVLSGADIKLSANGTLPKVENLWIASAQVSPYQNLLGALMQARLILSSLGFITQDLEATTTHGGPSDELEI